MDRIKHQYFYGQLIFDPPCSYTENSISDLKNQTTDPYKYGLPLFSFISILIKTRIPACKKMLLPPYDMECIQNAKAIIDADITLHHTIADIAARVGINSTKLTSGFRKVYGMGVYEYLRDQRLEKGKYLLENTWKSLKEISRMLGYKHCCNFNTAFRKKYGKPARAWRKGFFLLILLLSCI